MYYHTRGTAHVPALLLLALPLMAACAPTMWNADPPGADVPPFGIPAVFLTQGGNGMRPAVLTTLFAGLVIGGPAAAQTPNKPTTHRSTASETFVAVLSGAYAVPEVETRVTGTAELRLVGPRVHYQLHVDSLRDVTGAYIHIGHAGDTTPAVADLFEGVKPGPVSGVLARGTLEQTALHGTTLHQLVQALQQDDAYVTVHTRAHPAGEIRGQLRIQPVVANR
jgi:hypothetical protein